MEGRRIGIRIGIETRRMKNALTSQIGSILSWQRLKASLSAVLTPILLCAGPLGGEVSSALAATLADLTSGGSSSGVIVGQLIATGSVSVNDKNLPSGSSVFNNSLIKVACSAGSQAFVKLGNAGLVELRPGAQLLLRFSDNQIVGELRQGDIRIRHADGVRVAIVTSTGLVTSNENGATLIRASSRMIDGCDRSVDKSTIASVEGTTTAPQKGTGSAARSGGRAAAGSGGAATGLSPTALAALLFSVGIVGGITIVALTNPGPQVSPVTP